VNLSAHAATAVAIQDDPTFGPLKLANVGGIVGTVDQDRMVAVRARLRGVPIAVPVTSTVSDGGTGARRSGVTNVNESRDVPTFAFAHVVSNIDRVIDRIGPGHSRVTWTVTGVAGRQPFALTRENGFADRYDIAYASTAELGSALGALDANRFAAVTFTAVRVEAELGAQIREYRIDALERQEAGQWVPVDPSSAIPAVAGAPLVLRAWLSSYKDLLGTRTIQVALTVPAGTAGSTATLDVRGGASAAGEGAGLPDASSFAGLLDAFAHRPRNDEILAELRVGDSATPAASVHRRIGDVVTGGISVPVNVQAPAAAAARAPDRKLSTAGS
jgi:hypothetical protein